jgi:hypothetical protein
LAFDSRSAYSSHRTFMAADAGLTSKAHGVGFRVAYSIDITGCKRTDLAFERRPETGVITEARSTLFRGDTTADDGDICEHFELVAGLEPSEDRSPFTPLEIPDAVKDRSAVLTLWNPRRIPLGQHP